MTLQAIGLGPVHERVYRRLLAQPGADQIEDAGESAVVADLVRLGALRVEAGAGVRAEPPTILAEIAERMADDLARRQHSLSEARCELVGLIRDCDTPATPASSDGIERVDGLDAIRERLDELSFFARHSVHAVQPARGSSTGALPAQRADLRCRRRGLELRVVVDRPVRCTGVAEVEVRVHPHPVQRMVLIDGQVGVVPVSPGSSSALVVRQPSLLAALRNSFELLWSAAEPAGPPSTVSAADRELLTLLQSGDTDEVLARRAGISSRHLRRRVTRLLHELDAPSRFAAGVTAARRGWI